jgi:amino acid permease
MNKFNPTPEELRYYETEMLKFKLPWITKVFKKYGAPYLAYSILPVFLVLAILFVIYNSASHGYEWIFGVSKAIILFYLFIIGGFAIVSHITEFLAVNKLRKKLKLYKADFQFLVEKFQITGIND